MNSRRFDHLVSAEKECLRYGEAHCFRGLEVDNQLELGGQFDYFGAAQ
jgi:hypothetical protein